MKYTIFFLLLIVAACSDVGSDPNSLKNEQTLIVVDMPEVLRTDSTYSFPLEIIDPDTLQSVTLIEQFNSEGPDTSEHFLTTTHLDTALTRSFSAEGDYMLTISVTDRHPDGETITELFSAEVSSITETRNLTIVLSNPNRDASPDGVGITVFNDQGDQIAEGEIENGRFEFDTETAEGRSETLTVEFLAHGFLDFSDELVHSASGEFDFEIEPVPIEIQTDFPEISRNEPVTVDIRNYVNSVDPDDNEDVNLEQIDFSNTHSNLRIDQQDEFTYQFQMEGNTSESVLTTDLTVLTQSNSVTKTIEFPVTGTVTPTSLVIMPLGNSLTNDGRSRAPIWNNLVADGHEVDFVGDQYQQGIIPDPDHEGVGGITIQGIIDKAESLMRRHDPDYVNLMVGTNDIAWYTDEEVEDIAARWNQLVQILLDSSSPETYIVAATIPPVTSRETGRDGRDRAVLVGQYNELLRDYVEKRQNAGDLVVLADVEAELDVNQHLADDGVHLNLEGYTIMGTIYYEAIYTILLANQ